ncbi:MAG TPA: amino acid--tRNA ligase-related protein, partial [Egibacteraceae bacterium]|nr:amino acid--tRNA ligase-related protein [Egibacteraceae bacterium]
MAADAMSRTLVADLHRAVGDQVRVCGWVHEILAAEDPPMIVLRDHTGRVPLVGGGPQREGLAGLSVESAIEATGTVTSYAEEIAVVIEGLEVAGPATAPLPLTAGSPLDDRLDWRYLDLRQPRNRLIFEVQTTAERAMRAVWHEHGFMEIHSPK